MDYKKTYLQMDTEMHCGDFKIREPFLAFVLLHEVDDLVQQMFRGVL